MATTPWWLASIPWNFQGQPYASPTYIPPHIRYQEYLNSTLQQPQIGGITDLNSIIQQLLVQGLNFNHQSWPTYPMCQTQSNAWDHLNNQVTPIRATHFIPEDLEGPPSLPSTPRSDISECSTERLWKQGYALVQRMQDEELDQIKSALCKLRDDVEQIKGKQMMDRGPQPGFHTPPQPAQSQVPHKGNQHQEAKQPIQCYLLQELV